MQSTEQGDRIFYGIISFSGVGSIILPAGVVSNSTLIPYANLDISKLRHRVDVTPAQGSGTTAAAQANPIYTAKAAGVLTGFRVGAVVANIGAAACTVDLKKNGVSVLSAPVSLTSATAAYGLVAASIITTAYAAGETFEWVVTATAGGGTLATGLFAKFEADEANQ